MSECVNIVTEENCKYAKNIIAEQPTHLMDGEKKTSGSGMQSVKQPETAG
jgi:hypothetical protein